MSTKNRGDRIQLLQKVVMKHFTPVAPPDDRSVLEHLLYACCLENAPYESADEAFHRLQESSFDWNEVRVTTVSELRETLQTLPDPAGAAMRIKRCLQSIFENRYSFDLQELVKMNQGKALQELEKLTGVTRFVQAYVTQLALAGHAIPVSDTIMQVLLATEIVSESEASKGQTPGLERTIPKNKGNDFASCLHQLAVLNAQSPHGKQTKALMKEAGATETKRELPKPPKAEPATPAPEPAAVDDASKKGAVKKGTSKKPAAPPANTAKAAPATGEKKGTKKPAPEKASPSDSADAKKASAKKGNAKPVEPASKASGAKNTKRKPK